MLRDLVDQVLLDLEDRQNLLKNWCGLSAEKRTEHTQDAITAVLQDETTEAVVRLALKYCPEEFDQRTDQVTIREALIDAIALKVVDAVQREIDGPAGC